MENVGFRTPERPVQSSSQIIAQDEETLVISRKRHADAISVADQLNATFQGLLLQGTPLRQSFRDNFEQEIASQNLEVLATGAILRTHEEDLRRSHERMEYEARLQAEADSLEATKLVEALRQRTLVDAEAARLAAQNAAQEKIALLERANAQLKYDISLAAAGSLGNPSKMDPAKFSFSGNAVEQTLPIYGPGSIARMSPPGASPPSAQSFAQRTTTPTRQPLVAPSPRPNPTQGSHYGAGSDPMTIDDYSRHFALSNAAFSIPHMMCYAMGSSSTIFEGTPQLISSGLVFMGNESHFNNILPESPVLAAHFQPEMDICLRLQSLANRQWLTWQEDRQGLDNREEQGMLARYNKEMVKSLTPSKFDGAGGPIAAFEHWMAFCAFVRALNQFQKIMVEQAWIALFASTLVGAAAGWYSDLFNMNKGMVNSARAMLSEYNAQFIGLAFLKGLNDKLSGNDLHWGPSSKTPSAMLEFLREFVTTHTRHSFLFVSKPSVIVAPTVPMLMAVLTRVFQNYSPDLIIQLQAEMRNQFPAIKALYSNIRMDHYLLDPEWWMAFAKTHFTRLVILDSPSNKSSKINWSANRAPGGGNIKVFQNPNRIRRSNSFLVQENNAYAALAASNQEGEDDTAASPDTPSYAPSYAVAASSLSNADLRLNQMIFSLQNVASDEGSQRGNVIIGQLFSDDDETAEHVLAILNWGHNHSFVSFDIGPDDIVCGLVTKEGEVFEVTCWNCGKMGHFAAQCPTPKIGNGLSRRPDRSKMANGKGLGIMRKK